MKEYGRSSMLMLVMALAGCASKNDIGLNTYLSAPPVSSNDEEVALVAVLAEARTTTTPVSIVATATTDQVKRYLLAGYTLSDIFCDRFFRQTNLAARRRRFTRGAVTDVGGLISVILGPVAKVGSTVTGAVAAGFTRVDSTFRNYDEAFLVAPELDKVRTLTLAAQDSYRKETLTAANMPGDYMTARSSIVRYAGLCSYLGMQELLNRSINQQITALKEPEAKKPADAAPPAKPAAVGAAPLPATTATPVATLVAPSADARPNPVPNGRNQR